MLEMLEKLINEHGSSTILRERLELFSDKYSLLEEKNTHLHERNQELESQLQKANEEIERLQNIVNAASRNQGPEYLDEVTQKVVEFFFDADTNLSKNHVSAQLGIEMSMVSYHFDVLIEHKFIQLATVASGGYSWVRDEHTPDTPATYRITSKGRKFVVHQVRI